MNIPRRLNNIEFYRYLILKKEKKKVYTKNHAIILISSSIDLTF